MLVAALIAVVVVAVLTLGAALAVGLVAYLRKRPRSPNSESPCSEGGDQVACDVEVVILDETLQLNNFGDCSVRLESSGLDGSALLYPADVWMRKFDPRRSATYHLYYILHHDMFEEKFLEIKVSAADVALRPIEQSRSLQFVIWKLKPAVYMQATHVMEHRVFSGQLLKTVNFSRAPGRYYKIRANTRRSAASGLTCGSNAGMQFSPVQRLQLLRLRVEAEKASAMNASDRAIKACVVQPASGDALNRRLSDRMQELPANGVCSFSIRPGRSVCFKDLLRIRLDERTVAIEPPSKFGSLPLHCDIQLLDPGPEASRRIVSSDVLSELQLPRRSHGYAIAFSVTLGDADAIGDVAAVSGE